ncbi:MAG: transketolase family protein [Clostridiales Family XIII bacterium]|jgi:transketolase|nr:transketolase family protein [Clostridiales Family XIII bacterium]
MSVTTAKELKYEATEMRAAFCESMIELAEKNEDIVVLDADLMSAMGMKPFQSRFPDRTIDVGIQEANMVGVAAGLSAVGKIPYAHTFGTFMTRRAADQIFMSAAYAKANVKLIGSDPGVTASLNGGTHMPFEDMGIMRLYPTVTVLEPTDITLLKFLVKEISDIYGVFYMRLVRKLVTKVYEEGSTFEIGKANLLRDGGDATIISSGYCVAEALKAADALARENISVRVLDMFTWKPIDADAIKRAAADTGAIVTAENHNTIGGLGSAVAEVLVKTRPVPAEMIGSQDRFGQVGPTDFLAEEYGLTAPHIAEAVKKAVARKTQ